MFRTTVLILAATASMGYAELVEYSFDGNGSGSLGGVFFTNTEFQITLTGDTDDIFIAGAASPAFIDTAATFSVDGIGAGTFLIDISIIRNATTQVFVLGDWSANRALAVMTGAEFVDYNLTAPLGPVTDTSIPFEASFSLLSTTAGAFSLPDINEMTFQAYGVPAPGAAGLLAIGGLVTTRRRR